LQRGRRSSRRRGADGGDADEDENKVNERADSDMSPVSTSSVSTPLIVPKLSLCGRFSNPSVQESEQQQQQPAVKESSADDEDGDDADADGTEDSSSSKKKHKHKKMCDGDADYDRYNKVEKRERKERRREEKEKHKRERAGSGHSGMTGEDSLDQPSDLNTDEGRKPVALQEPAPALKAQEEED
jgi:hypothetical protein